MGEEEQADDKQNVHQQQTEGEQLQIDAAKDLLSKLKVGSFPIVGWRGVERLPQHNVGI